MEDIVVDVTIENIDDGDDVDDESREFDIEADKTDEIIIRLEVPKTAEIGEFNVKVKADGREEDNRAVHEDVFNFKINKIKLNKNICYLFFYLNT